MRRGLVQLMVKRISGDRAISTVVRREEPPGPGWWSSAAAAPGQPGPQVCPLKARALLPARSLQCAGDGRPSGPSAGVVAPGPMSTPDMRSTRGRGKIPGAVICKGRMQTTTPIILAADQPEDRQPCERLGHSLTGKRSASGQAQLPSRSARSGPQRPVSF
jgi:hypothetical protein